MASTPETAGPAAPARPGALLAGRYRVVRRLGSGGMATVLLAEDERLGRRVAVKRLHTGSPGEAADRLRREARLGASLNHPSLVTVYDAQPDGESLLIVMELIDGSSLSQELEHGPLPEERALEVLRGVAAGLDHVHERGVVHRDVKPSNILITHNGRAKLADLGIARALEDTALTQSGVVLGTLRYIAPEQLAGEEVGPPADIYSLALIAYEALSGTRVRKGSSLSEILRHSECGAPDLRADRPGTPAAAAELLGRALDRDPSRRPGSAKGFVEDLEAALRGRGEVSGAAAPPPPPPPPATPEPPLASAAPGDARRRDARRLALPGALLLAMLALAALLILAGGDGDGNGGTSTADQGAERPRAAQGTDAGEGAAPEPSSPAEAQTEPAPAQPAAPAPAAESPGPAPAPAPAGDPAAVVIDFYELAAAGDYGAADALTTDAFDASIGDYSQFDTLESVEFRSASVTESDSETATVAFSDVATHRTFTDTCSGRILLVDDRGWKLEDLLTLDCERS